MRVAEELISKIAARKSGSQREAPLRKRRRQFPVLVRFERERATAPRVLDQQIAQPLRGVEDAAALPPYRVPARSRGAVGVERDRERLLVAHFPTPPSPVEHPAPLRPPPP